MQPYTTSIENKDKAKEAMRDMAQRGEMPGRVPLGYRRVMESNRTKTVIDEPRARLVRLAFGIVATGDKPLRSVLKDLTAYGLRSRTGKPLGVSSLWGMLTNPFYIGTVRYEGIVTQCSHEPMVDRRLFDLAQIQLDKRRRNRA